MKTKNMILIAFILVVLLSGCKKFLEEKSDQKLAVPETLDDLQALLNNNNLYNIVDPYSGEVSAGDFYLTDTDLNGITSQPDQRLYTWEKDHLYAPATLGNDWLYLYTLVYLSNSILEKMEKIDRTPQNAAQFDNIKGQACFNRGKAYYNALQLWSVAYNKTTAVKDRGIVIRESTDFNIPSKRSTVEEGYSTVVADLTAASKLLPLPPLHPSRPARQAAFGYLARVFLAMGIYDKAFAYADSCIGIKGTLLDYNTLSTAKTYPVDRFNTEVVYECFVNNPSIMSNIRAKIVPELYNRYAADDLRKEVFFKNNNNGTYGWRGGYAASQGIFPGVVIDEQYLIRAECEARLGNVPAALRDLNALLIKRYKTGTFKPLTAASAPEALSLVLDERRKELPFRNLRWSDIKRLNAEGAKINLTRLANGITYTLPANDPRFALEIPEEIIARSGIDQNIR
ncbi:RagB/SusD family nutrient uptake outer membrane protein [Pedobacter borealis]|uniref:RagB/SusD family nutrient uptake outer membrane protein n=1 Tax=Pedobacter borealis TaxID=475254 RepID=UPI0004935C2F|nr:RagB/SusD family nutrient uptake outer membrane protein [Pedobacter borealis]